MSPRKSELASSHTIVNANGHKDTIPGFGRHPPGAKPAADWPMPFPADFCQALFSIPELEPKPLPNPFTMSWQKRWLSFCDSDHATQRCNAFFAGEGLYGLARTQSPRM